ncbi:LytR C-terminal domain-containing protein [Candidatus Daviesbacteria bacterium]|nr:LytR C-terminal domain-containing protein [Candidatus Daviesbacteria bacterium]
MDESQTTEKEQSEPQEDEKQETSTVKRSFIVSNNRPLNYENEFTAKKSSNKITLLLVGLLILLIVAGAYFLRVRIKSLVAGTIAPTPVPTPITTPEPTATPNPLVRSDWSFEVLNGSGEGGLAKKIAGKVTDLGYQVVKVGNADDSDYDTTQVLVKADLRDKIDLVIADLKDAIKIASVAGELKDGTASARIIIGKDSI